MSTHNMGFYEDLTKIIFELSSNTLSLLLHLVFLACNSWINVLHVAERCFYNLATTTRYRRIDFQGFCFQSKENRYAAYFVMFGIQYYEVFNKTYAV